MVNVIDARTGKENLAPGDILDWGEGDYLEIRDVKDRFFRASVYAEGKIGGHPFGPDWFPLHVRFTHPGFFLQRVAFISS